MTSKFYAQLTVIPEFVLLTQEASILHLPVSRLFCMLNCTIGRRSTDVVCVEVCDATKV